MILSKILRKQQQLLFRVAHPNDKEKIIEFLANHFVKEEPCARALKISNELTRSVYLTTVVRCLQFPFSTVVLQEDGRLAACLLASVWNRTDSLEDANYGSSGLPEDITLFVDFLNKAHANFWKIAPPTVHSVIHREIGSVAAQFTRSGIATKMVTSNMTKTNLKKYNIGGVISETSSLANQIVLEKAGFTCLKEMPFSDIVDSRGKQVLHLDDGTSVLRLNYKAIEDFKNLPQ